MQKITQIINMKKTYIVSGLPFCIAPGNVGSFQLDRSRMTLRQIQKFAVLVRGLQAFRDTGPDLVEDLAQDLDAIIDGYTNPQLIDHAHLEHEVYLLVSISIIIT